MQLWEAPGMYVEAPKGSGVEWFFLEVGPKGSAQPTLLLLHGMPSYSYVWRDVLPGLAAAGRRAIAVDLPGWGNSTMLQVGYIGEGNSQLSANSGPSDHRAAEESKRYQR
jgi:pimeloyl-ACP methyl ester carboxylesterase